VRILIAEDEARIARQLATALEAAGYAVDTADDGERADFLARTSHYDAVVLDLGLPRLDGLSALRGWREQGLTMPVLILTRAAAGTRRCSASTAAPTITCPSRFKSKKSWRGCARSSGAPVVRPRHCSSAEIWCLTRAPRARRSRALTCG
jgi:CheY-like chemotaxis protein